MGKKSGVGTGRRDLGDEGSGRSMAAVRDQLLRLSTALVSDALGKIGAMDHGMTCYSKCCRMAGPAATVQVHTADILMVGKGLSLAAKGEVLVIDGQGELNTALWGGITTSAALGKGLAGVVIDGAIRDVGSIQRSALPVFARAVVPNAGGAEYKGAVGVSVACGGVVVRPGDWVVGDEDGVVVVPLERLGEVLEVAQRLSLVEKQISREVAQGKDLAELLGYHERLAAKGSVLPQMRYLAGKGNR